MKYKIIGDSSLDLNDELQNWIQAEYAPLTVEVGGRTFIDDGTVNVKEMLSVVAGSKDICKSAAPSPNDFLALMQDNCDGYFIITLSSKLSGSYNSARVARDMALEENPGMKIHVIDSLGASAGQTTIAVTLQRCIDKGMEFDEICKTIDYFVDHDQLYFLLDNIETLMKNGRMSKVKGIFAQLLRIKPILGDNGEGEIGLFDKARTYTKALDKLAELFITTPLDTTKRTFIIAHCEAYERALLLKEKVMARREYLDIQIVPMKALSAVYANVGGLVCAI